MSQVTLSANLHGQEDQVEVSHSHPYASAYDYDYDDNDDDVVDHHHRPLHHTASGQAHLRQLQPQQVRPICWGGGAQDTPAVPTVRFIFDFVGTGTPPLAAAAAATAATAAAAAAAAAVAAS